MVDNLMAMLIFAAGSATVISSTDNLISLNQESYETIAATTVARNVFEDLRRRDPEEYSAVGMPSGQIQVDASGTENRQGKFKVVWNYRTQIPHTGMNEVAINVSWFDARARERDINFTSTVRSPRSRPTGIIRPWSGWSQEMLNTGTCSTSTTTASTTGTTSTTTGTTSTTTGTTSTSSSSTSTTSSSSTGSTTGTTTGTTSTSSSSTTGSTSTTSTTTDTSPGNSGSAPGKKK